MAEDEESASRTNESAEGSLLAPQARSRLSGLLRSLRIVVGKDHTDDEDHKDDSRRTSNSRTRGRRQSKRNKLTHGKENNEYSDEIHRCYIRQVWSNPAFGMS